MPHYFFDSRDDDALTEDDVGIHCHDIEAVKLVAAKSLAEYAREVIPGSLKRVLSVEVRDALGPVLRAMMHFETVILRPT